MKYLKLLYPGLGIKRWLFLALFGMILISFGIMLFFYEGIIKYFVILKLNTGFFVLIIGIVSVILGIIIVYLSIKKMIAEISVSEKLSNEDIFDKLLEKKMLEKGPKVTVLGGGTGLSNLLRGLKKDSSNLSAIVTVADDGGSSGRLRDELGILPPGDIRNCLVALADRETLMEQLFRYRFSSEGHLVGHSFGNLFIASMTEVLGDFEDAIKESSKVLAIRGQVLPATNENIKLGARYCDGTEKVGESVIPKPSKKIDEVFLEPGDCQATNDAIKAIRNAEILVIGPGSLYTSILPNLLVNGIASELKKSDAVKIYVCNVMTQPGETDDYSASDHVEAIEKHVGKGVFDYVIVNKEKGGEKLEKRYKEEGAFAVEVDNKLKGRGDIKVISDDLLTEDGYIRHDPDSLANLIYKIAEKSL
ncbi:MAG: gluconeogenesis factor YvcK family protein [Bacillota bacterium]